MARVEELKEELKALDITNEEAENADNLADKIYDILYKIGLNYLMKNQEPHLQMFALQGFTIHALIPLVGPA